MASCHGSSPEASCHGSLLEASCHGWRGETHKRPGSGSRHRTHQAGQTYRRPGAWSWHRMHWAVDAYRRHSTCNRKAWCLKGHMLLKATVLLHTPTPPNSFIPLHCQPLFAQTVQEFLLGLGLTPQHRRPRHLPPVPPKNIYFGAASQVSVVSSPPAHAACSFGGGKFCHGRRMKRTKV